MNWLTSIFSASGSSLVESIGKAADGVFTSDEERLKFEYKVKELIQKREQEIEQTIRKELEAKERVIVAEMNQGDNFTKRARPTVVYAGLVFIFLNYVVFPVVSHLGFGNAVSLELPSEFWMAWGGICATWSVGRSFEKAGVKNKETQVATGSKKTSLLD